MKVCFIRFGFYCPQDVLTPLYEYSQILRNKGFYVTVFVRDNKKNIANTKNLIIKTVCKEYFNRKLTHIIFLLKLISILKKEQFDIVHVYNFSGISILPIFCKKCQKKWFLQIQSGAVKGRINNFFRDKLTAFEARFFDRIIVLSKGLKVKLFGKRSLKNISILPLGVNVERFLVAKKDRIIWQKYGLPKKNIILIYVGDLGKTRKLENMLRAFKVVVDQQNIDKIRLVIIGGENKDVERMKNESRNLSLCDRVLFLGKIPYEDIPAYLVNSDIGLAYIPKTKIFNVQPPLKTIEYLAASLPVLATNTFGNLEIIKDVSNCVITSDDYWDFAKGILRFFNNTKLRSRLNINNINTIKEYDWENIVQRLIQIYQQL